MSPRLTAGIAWTVAVLALALLPAVAPAAEPGAAGPPQIPVPPDRFPTGRPHGHARARATTSRSSRRRTARCA